MRRLLCILLLATSCLTLPAHALDFWHSNTVWIGHGQCAVEFTFDSGLQDIRDLKVAVSAVNTSGQSVLAEVLEISQFGESSAMRYASVLIEDEAMCGDSLSIVVNQASAFVDGQRTDLLQNQILTTRDFRPFAIRIK